MTHPNRPFREPIASVRRSSTAQTTTSIRTKLGLGSTGNITIDAVDIALWAKCIKVNDGIKVPFMRNIKFLFEFEQRLAKVKVPSIFA